MQTYHVIKLFQILTILVQYGYILFQHNGKYTCEKDFPFFEVHRQQAHKWTEQKNGARPKRQALTATVVILRSSFRLVLWQETLKSSCIDSGKKEPSRVGRCILVCARACGCAFSCGSRGGVAALALAHVLMKHCTKTRQQILAKIKTLTPSTHAEKTYIHIYTCIHVYV